MAFKKKNGKYGCMFCEKEFTDPNMANAHRDTEHDYVLLPITKEELANLLHYITMPINKNLIPPELFKRMSKYLKTKKSNIEIQ